MNRDSNRPSTSKLPVKNGSSKTSIPGLRRSRSLIRSNSTLSNRNTMTSQRAASQTPRGISERSRSKSIERKPKKADTRPITNKTWQTKQELEVEAYLKEIGAEAYLTKSRRLRPLTLNNFVQTCNILLESLINIESLNTFNYVERLPNILNILSYPGTISASSLKTAYTLHAWPSILAVLSWLVGAQNLIWDTSACYDSLSDYEDDQNSKSEYIARLINKSVMMCYHTFNFCDETDFNMADVEKDFETTIKEIYGISDNFEVELQERRMKCSLENEQISKFEGEDAETRELLEREIQELRNRLEEDHKYFEETENTNEKLKEDIENIITKSNTLDHDCEPLEEELLKLQNDAGCIPTESDLADLTSQISGNEIIKISLEEKLKKNRELSYNMDIKLSQLRADFSKQVKQHNAELFEYSLKYKELEQLFLPENSEINSLDIQVLNDIYEKRKTLLKQNEENNLRLKEEKDQLCLEMQEAEKQLEIIEDTFIKLEKIRISKEKEVEKLEQHYEKEAEKLSLDIGHMQKIYQEHCTNLSKKEEVSKTLSIKIQKEKDRLVEGQKKYKELAETMMQFFKDIQKKTAESVPRYQEILQGYSELRLKAINNILKQHDQHDQQKIK